MRALLRDITLVVWPGGGQGTARRNAWAAMVVDAQRARERAEAEEFFARVATVPAAGFADPGEAVRAQG
ncbi:MAG TPA: hypothetical protein VMH41_01960 [Mycobacteriales bacterium]|nr:hypothetical protein [Mycobacteriales bacterium]